MVDDNKYMNIAESVAYFSTDEQHKVGACIVKDNKVIGKGSNGFIKQFNGEVPKSNNRELPLKMQKYSYIKHAEMDAVFNSKENISGSTLYTTLFPCNECAKLIIAAGIKEVVYKEEYHVEEIVEMSKILLDGCGIKYRKIE